MSHRPRSVAALIVVAGLCSAARAADSNLPSNSVAEAVAREAMGVELVDAPEPRASVPDPAKRMEAMDRLMGAGILLIPESTNDRVMAFDPTTGDLIDPDFVPSDPTNLGTPVNALLSDGGGTILVSDQIFDVIHEYSLAGSYLGVFAPSGGANTAVYDNARGFEENPVGTNYLAASGDTDSIPNFDGDGNYSGDFVPPGSGGLDGPFDANIFLSAGAMLVSGIASDTIHAYASDGTPLPPFASVDTFPEQIYVEEGAGGPGVPAVWVANFFGTQEGILVYDDGGTLLDTLNPGQLGGYRGVHPLENGNLLVTTGTGVHEITAAGIFVETKLGGVSARFIELVQPLDPEIFADGFESGDTSAWSTTVP